MLKGVFGEAAGTIGQQLAGVPQEHQKGMTSLGLVREVSAEVWGVSVHVGKVLPRCGTSGAAIWGRYLGAVGC